MRQDSKFGAAGARGARRAASRRDDPTRIVILRPASGRCCLVPIAPEGRNRPLFAMCFCSSWNPLPRPNFKGDVPRTTNHDSKITAFLIDTLAIRISRKLFDCIAGARSNRHSPATLNLRRKSQNQRKSRPHFDGFSSCSAGLQPSTSLAAVASCR